MIYVLKLLFSPEFLIFIHNFNYALMWTDVVNDLPRQLLHPVQVPVEADEPDARRGLTYNVQASEDTTAVR